MRIVDVYWFT